MRHLIVEAMAKLQKITYIVCGLMGMLGFFLWFFSCRQQVDDSKLQGAYTDYLIAEKTKAFAEREIALNRALSLYRGLEQEGRPGEGSGKLFYNIANCYFQLGEYPWAIYYYYRSMLLMPRNQDAAHNLSVALSKLEIKPTPLKAFPLPIPLSLPEWRQLLSGLTLLLFLLLSAAIWIVFLRSLIKYLIVSVGCVWIMVLTYLLFLHYLLPIEGVFVQASLLYQGPGNEYDRVSNRPLPSGTKVEVLEALAEGEWLRIYSPDQTIGYTPSRAIRIF